MRGAAGSTGTGHGLPCPLPPSHTRRRFAQNTWNTGVPRPPAPAVGSGNSPVCRALSTSPPGRCNSTLWISHRASKPAAGGIFLKRPRMRSRVTQDPPRLCPLLQPVSGLLPPVQAHSPGRLPGASYSTAWPSPTARPDTYLSRSHLVGTDPSSQPGWSGSLPRRRARLSAGLLGCSLGVHCVSVRPPAGLGASLTAGLQTRGVTKLQTACDLLPGPKRAFPLQTSQRHTLHHARPTAAPRLTWSRRLLPGRKPSWGRRGSRVGGTER